MAKRNEENLSKLSRKGMYEKLNQYGSYSKKKVYKFKKASTEQLQAIRKRKIAEKVALASSIAVILLSIFFYFV